MPNFILPILTLVLGTLFGIFTNFLASIVKRRETIALRIFDQIIDARNEVAEVVCELTSLPIGDNIINRNQLIEYRDKTIKLYYKYFDFLPKEVLDTLILLEVALDNPKCGPYEFSKNRILPMPKASIVSFIERCTLTENSKYTACMYLNSKNQKVIECEVIQLHARYVLYTLNKYASLGSYMSLTSDLRKNRIITKKF